MEPETPAAPPESDVIKLARKAADLTALAAAEASRAHDQRGISVTYWRDVERGYGGRRGKRVTVRASDRALAVMARVVGVTPAQLTAAGRGDAALVLEKMLRPTPDPVPAADADAERQAAAELMPDPVERAIWLQGWLTPAQRRDEIEGLREVRRRYGHDSGIGDTGGDTGNASTALHTQAD